MNDQDMDKLWPKYISGEEVLKKDLGKYTAVLIGKIESYPGHVMYDYILKIIDKDSGELEMCVASETSPVLFEKYPDVRVAGLFDSGGMEHASLWDMAHQRFTDGEKFYEFALEIAKGFMDLP